MPAGRRRFGARTSYALAVDGETLLVDSLVVGDGDPALGALDDLVGGRVRILVSKPFHTRSAELLWRRYAARRHVPTGMRKWRRGWAIPPVLRP